MSKAWLACCFLLPTLLRAEEVTMAWHFAVPTLDGFRAAAGSESERVIADPPSPTVFAAKGDRLIDLSAELRKIVNGGDETWLIWNETRHQLIARGKATTLASVEEISRFRQQQEMVDLTINWYEGVAPGDAISEGKVPDATLNAMVRNGEKVTSDRIPDKPASLSDFQFEVEPNASEERTSVHLQYSVDWREPSSEGPLDWLFYGTALVKAAKGSPPLILGQAVSPTGKTWTIAASAQVLLLDGTPIANLLETERDGKIQPVLRQVAEQGDGYLHAEVKVKEAPYYLLSMPSQAGFYILHDLDRPSESGDDPVAATPPKSDLPHSSFTGFSDAMVPDEAKAFAGGPLVDCRKLLVDRRKLLESAGVVAGDTDIFGYEPRSDRFIVGSNRKEFVDRVGALLTWSCQLSAEFFTTRLKKTSGEEREGYLADVLIRHQSGHRVSLECARGDRTLVCAKVEASKGQSEGTINLRYELTEPGRVSGEDAVRRGMATLMNDRETILQSGRSKDEAVSFSAKVRLTNPVENR